MEEETIGRAVYRRRMELGVSAAAAGRVVGVTGWTIQQWEAGTHIPAEHRIQGLAQFLGRSTEQVRQLLAKSQRKEQVHGEG